MPPSDCASLRVDAPYRLRRIFYRALAHEIAAAPAPAGAVLEHEGADPRPWVTVRPGALVRAAADASPGPLGLPAPVPARRAPEPIGLAFDRIGSIVPGADAGRDRGDPVPLDPPAISERLAGGDWLAVQTFWLRGRHGGLYAARRFRFAAADPVAGAARLADVGRAFAREWSGEGLATTVRYRAGFAARRRWRERRIADLAGDAWRRGDADLLAGTAEPRAPPVPTPTGAPTGHAVVFGASGAGKTTYLARRAADAIRDRVATIVLDLHGDLAPAVVGRLGPRDRARVVAVDAGAPPVPGISALPRGPDEDRIAAILVAAVKRLSADGTDVYWGFRLERIYDTFVRLVLESGGTLVDLYDLLTSEDRRDAARLGTRRPELGRFLDELRPVVRRNPEFLWSAATRLSKVVLVPALAELLAPPEGGLPLEAILGDAGAVLVRLPLAQLGPEAAAFAGTLLLARAFLGVAGEGPLPRVREVLVVLDEVHGFSPRLVAEVLAEGRKYGLRAIVATQYPERLAPELRAAAAGASTQFVAFRVPPPAAAEAGGWLGLAREESEAILPHLPVGRAVELDPETGRLVPVPPGPDPPADPMASWAIEVDRTRALGPPPRPSSPAGTSDAIERLLLAVLAAEENGRPLSEGAVVAAALALPGLPIDAARLSDAWPTVVRERWVEVGPLGVRLTDAGARSLGLGAPTEATRESAEHRRLLLAAFRVLARRGYRMEILRQGRFDTTLPDARLDQLPPAVTGAAPGELAGAIDRLRTGWAWRYFGGRNVHVEAEVTGARRAERIRHDLSKAAARGAVVLFVVGTAAHARAVRASLGRIGAGRDRAIVWVLRGAPTEPIESGARGR